MRQPYKVTCHDCEAFCGFIQPDGSEPIMTGCHVSRPRAQCPMLEDKPVDEEEERNRRRVAAMPGLGCTTRKGMR